MFATFLNEYERCRDNARPDSENGTNLLVPIARATHHPDWPAIEAALRRLDGANFRLVFVAERPPEAHIGWPFDGAGLAIGGGGANGLYACTFSEAYEISSWMCRPGDERATEAVVMFGFTTVTSSKRCVEFDEILAVARGFAVQGRLPSRYNWEPPLPSRFLDR